MNNIIFLFIALLIIVGAIFAIASKKPMNSALGLLVVSLSLSALYLMLDAKFLFMAQIIVYVGAVITLILVILMFLNIDEKDLPNEDNKFIKISMGIVIMLPFNFIILNEFLKLPVIIATKTVGSIENIASTMFSKYLVPFELISVLLLVALLGAIVIGKKNG
jgi:NADH-quinone oxidoreductase subunit J